MRLLQTLKIGLFGLLLSFTACTSPSKTNSNTPLKVLSYNIHYSLGMDGNYDLERIAKVIMSQHPDIVGLQEIGNADMANKLGALTGMHVVFGPSKEDDKGYGDAILSRFPFENKGNFHIPTASSSRYQAMAVDVKLPEQYGAPGAIRFINTHFDWLATIGSQEARLATVDVIERGFMKDSQLPSILTGDLNANPDSAPLLKLAAKGWITNPAAPAYFTIPVDKPDRQIDYVLARPASQWRIISTEVIDEQIASDHLPVLMTLQLQ